MAQTAGPDEVAHFVGVVYRGSEGVSLAGTGSGAMGACESSAKGRGVGAHVRWLGWRERRGKEEGTPILEPAD